MAHVDDFMVVSKDSKVYLEKIKETFNLRSEGNMDYFLGCEIRRKKNGLWEASAKTSVHKVITKIEQAMGDVPLVNAPAAIQDHPEEDSSAPLNPLGLHHYQLTIGSLNWIVTL